MIKEERLQQDIFIWFHNTYPALRGLFYHNYNNPPNKITGAKLIGMGLVKGIPDMTLALTTNNFGSLYLELKRNGEKPKAHQAAIFEKLRAGGNRVEWVDNFEDAVKIINEYIKNSSFLDFKKDLF